MTDAREITAALGGTWCGVYGIALCPAHGDTRPSLSLSNAASGRLLARCHTGCSFDQILDALRGLGLVAGHGSLPVLDPAEVALREDQVKVDMARRENQARRIWAETLPIEGMPAETYLGTRGIGFAIPGTIRFHPACWHGATAQRLPAMVALIEGGQGFAVHRTYLRQDGTAKADVSPAKAMLGNARGGAVRLLWHVPGAPLMIAEGIETALSLVALCPFPANVWAALSTSGIKGLALPRAPGRLTIATDGDQPGREAGNDLAVRAHSSRWAVSMLPAPEGSDWNDVLQGRADA